MLGELSGGGDPMVARDGTVFAAGLEAVHVIDARDPRNPRSAYDIQIEGCRAAYPYTACVIDLAVDRGYLYVATTSPDAIRVFRLGDGEARPLSTLPLPSQPSGVAAAGPLAFVSIMDDTVERHDDGLLVFDVSSPSSPREIFRDTTPDRAWDVAAAGASAYLVHSDLDAGAVRAYVVRQASTRVELVDDVAVPGRAQRLAVSGGRVFVAAGNCGTPVSDAEPGPGSTTGRRVGWAPGGQALAEAGRRSSRPSATHDRRTAPPRLSRRR